MEATLTASDAAANHHFGFSVAVSGNLAVVGRHAGAVAYVFRHEGTEWIEETKLTVSGEGSTSTFGESVSIEDGLVVVGARYDDGIEDRTGAAYLFQRLPYAWKQAARLFATDGAYGDGFGRGVSVSGDLILVGACGDDDGAPGAGSAYIFSVASALDIPTVSTWGMVAMALLLLTTATIVITRRALRTSRLCH